MREPALWMVSIERVLCFFYIKYALFSLRVSYA